MQRPTLKVMGIFLGSFILFTWGLRTEEVIGFDSRFYLFAEEMWRHGLTWFPTTYHQPYPDYPGTSTWLIIWAANWAGMLSKYAAVMPTAIAAAWTVSLVYRLGEDQRKSWGWYAACLLLLTAGFVRSARAISLDMFVTLLTTACFYCLYEADKLRDAIKIRWVYVFLVLGFACRGPIGLVIPTSVVCVYYLVSGRYRQCILSGLIAAGLLAVCSAVLLMLAFQTGGHAFMQDVLRMEFAGRISNYFLPPTFYLTSGLGNYALAFPLAVLSMLGILYYAVTTRSRVNDEPVFLFQLIGWVVIVLVGMSIPGDKKIRYILPIMPAAALLAAYPLIAMGNQRYFSWLRMIMRLLFLFLPGFLMVALLLLSYFMHDSVWLSQVHYVPVLIGLGFVQALSLRRWLRYHTDASLLFYAVIAFMVGYLYIFEPAELYVERARDFSMRLASMSSAQQTVVIFYRESKDGLPIKYIINVPEDQAPLFIDQPDALLTAPPLAVIVMRASEWATLPAAVAAHFEVTNSDSLGHVKVVIIRRKP